MCIRDSTHTHGDAAGNDMQALRTTVMDITAAAAVKGCYCIKERHLHDAIDMIQGDQCTFGDLLRYVSRCGAHPLLWQVR